MLKLMRYTAIAVSIIIPVFATVTTSAQSSSGMAGGSDASVYQPPTSNPQSDVGTGYQGASPGLQPIPGQPGGFTQEKLTGVSDLRVDGVTDGVEINDDSVEPAVEFGVYRPLFVLVMFSVLAGGVYVYVKSRGAESVSMEPSEKAVQPKQEVATKPKVQKKRKTKSKPRSRKARKK